MGAKKLKNPKYTIVQHSGFGYGGKVSLRHGLEERQIRTEAKLKRVRNAGGVVFDSYREAYEYAFKEQYRNTRGMYPNAPGPFSTVKIDELRLYIPPTVKV